MAVKLISYDLNRPRQQYAELYDAIKALSSNGAFWHYLDSVWVMPCSLTCQQVVDRLKQYMDGNDELLVLDITSDAYQGLQSKESWEIFSSIMR